MPKALCLVGAIIAILLLLIFGLDLVARFPFGRASSLMDIISLLCALVLGYLSWTTLMEQK
jgi:hypothetical protein